MRLPRSDEPGNQQPTRSAPHHRRERPSIQRELRDWQLLLIYQAEVVAREDRDDQLRPSHLAEARRRLRYRPRRRRAAILSYVGGALLGAGAQGFVLELFMDPLRPPLIAMFVVALVFGLVVAFVFAGRE